MSFGMKLIWIFSCCLFVSTAFGCYENGDYYGYDVRPGQYKSVGSAQACQQACQQDHYCKYWTWTPSWHNACWLKYWKGKFTAKAGAISGPKNCPGGNPPGPSPNPTPSGGSGSLRVMSYNMFGWMAFGREPHRAQNIFKAIRAFGPDILGTQETEGNQNRIAAGSGSGYSVAGVHTGNAIIYRSSALAFERFGHNGLSQRDKWGTRSVVYAHFTHRATGKKVDFFNTHYCVCTDKITTCCNPQAQYQSAIETDKFISSVRRPGSIVVLTGDLNVQSGYESSWAVQYLKNAWGNAPVPLEDTFRTANGAGANGSTFGASGKIDYVFASKGTRVLSAKIDRGGYGAASDHFPVNAVIGL